MIWSGQTLTNQLTGSGDATNRIHTLDASTPTLTAILRGHTSTVKSAVFVNETTVASAGRDGHILVYDIRCPGFYQTLESTLPCNLDFKAQSGITLNPVATIKLAHGDGKRTAIKVGMMWSRLTSSGVQSDLLLLSSHCRAGY
jgi:denticleless